MKLIKKSVAIAIISSLSLYASENHTKSKQELRNNMMLKYNTLPKSAEIFTDAFSNGVFYGRLRMNTFKWDWKNDTATIKDNDALGLGGSIIYKTAPLAGISATAALYYSNSPFSGFRGDADNADTVKAGKDTFSRKRVRDSGDWSMSVLGQAYLQYNYSKTTAKVGRQIFESFLTKSNDTKMIPNTFEGYTLEMKEIPKTRIRGAYLYSQKLRDHTEFHDVITYQDSSGDSWSNNDDTPIHQGLSYSNLKTAGKDTNNALIILDASNKAIDNLRINVTYGTVPKLFSSITGEVNYTMSLPEGFFLTPSVRYMKQMDNGAGKIGGASLNGSLAGKNGNQGGYKDADTLDTSLAMGRLVLKKRAFKVKIAYSAVADEADIIAPWRGFPTGGYTRAMGQYNWRANTKTTCAEVYYDFDKANLVTGFNAMVRYAMQDFDEAKQVSGVQADSNVIHIDLNEKITKDLYAKVRVGLVSADNRVGSTDVDSYNEYRFEVNYLF